MSKLLAGTTGAAPDSEFPCSAFGRALACLASAGVTTGLVADAAGFDAVAVGLEGAAAAGVLAVVSDERPLMPTFLARLRKKPPSEDR